MGTTFLGFSMERGSGALKGSSKYFVSGGSRFVRSRLRLIAIPQSRRQAQFDGQRKAYVGIPPSTY